MIRSLREPPACPTENPGPYCPLDRGSLRSAYYLRVDRLIRALRLRAAIEYIEECRLIHVHWITFLAAMTKDQLLEPQYRHVGDITHHEKWVHNYDHVLKVLRG